MSSYPDIIQQDLISFCNLPQQQKNYQATKFKNSILKPTHDIKLAEKFSPKTKQLENMDESSKKLGEKFNKEDFENENQKKIVPVEIETDDRNKHIENFIRALPKSSKNTQMKREKLRSLMRSKNSLRIEQDDSGRATILGIPIQVVGINSLKLRDFIHNLTHEVHKALSSTGFSGKSMKKDSDFLLMNNIENDLGYTSEGDKSSKRTSFLLKHLAKKNC